MAEEHRHEKRREPVESPEDIKEILNVVSSEVPSLIKNLLSSVFSEEAGRSMGKAAASYYKELKEGGLPENVAVRLTEDYMRTFTSLGDMLRGAGKVRVSDRDYGEIGAEIERKIHEKLEKKKYGRDEEEDE